MFLEDKFHIKETNNIGIAGLTNQLISFCVSDIYDKHDRNIIILTNTLYEANLLYSALSKVNENVCLFPMDDFLTIEALAISPELKSIRLNTLNRLSSSDKNIVITNLTGFLRYLPAKKIWNENIIRIEKNTDVNKEKLYERLLNIGYESSSLVTKSGEISSRGYIIDVYPISGDNPIRIEFWGDTIDSMREFDVDTQLSIKEIDELVITPYSEFINEKNIEIEEKQKYLPHVVDEVSSISEYLDNPITIYKDYKQIMNGYRNLRQEIMEYSKTSDDLKTNYMMNIEDINVRDEIFLLNIDNILEDKKLNKTYQFNSKKIDNFNSNFEYLNEYLENNLVKNKKIVLALSNKSRLQNLTKFITVPTIETNINELYESKVNLVNINLEEGFEFENYIVLTENEIFKNQITKSNLKSKFKLGTKIKSIDNLTVGDYVVHLSHGIGVYNGIKTLKKGNNEKDYLEILYKGNDKLYIPAAKIDLISKYSSKEGAAPKINKLDGIEWKKTKLRVKSKVKEIAEKLIKISIERASRPGFAFLKDEEEEYKFDSEFRYEPTKDQYIAIARIKESMEKSTPMDMLLCGDVGYGKTEVAFRAIFKAINSGKQVAYLCPTTILSNQQYKNAVDRFQNFGINIALLNRFTTSKESKDIIKKLNEGKIDLLFGTHRILSNDINFKDLGLLVIDEEQRFGVAHKEKIKEYKSNIDVLTLSATPIPRTLQMSLVGIRELSLIETPPLERYPVQTYVLEDSDALVKEAIYKELSRKGQIFILYNSVEHIEEKMLKIKSLVPEARICFAHGKMTKNQIEDTMMSFINYEYDILICTTIIETGIDIPNVNTLIIYDSDRFGLSQLYQIRGRVGRSNKIAYAYLLYQKNKVLNEDAVKRLNAIKEFTELGSGFQIAMRDLSIRGAGDILGSEQAGFIDSVGYDLYMKILNNEVEELKGNNVEEEELENEQPLIEVSTHIKDKYVSNDEVKIEIHRMINGIDSKEKLDEIKKEITDRFGKVDDDLEVYMYSEWFENLCKKIGIKRVDQTNLYVELVLKDELVEKINVDDLFMEAASISMNFKFRYQNDNFYIKLLLNNLEKHYIYYLTELLDKISIMTV